MDNKYIIVHKPYGMLSQFTQEHENQSTLSELSIPYNDVYAVGRLDADSEGLLLLSNDNFLIKNTLTPEKSVYKTYVVQVDGSISEDAIEQLQRGVSIKHKGKNYHTLPAIVKPIPQPDYIGERNPPIRVRKNIPTTWIEVQLTEGKNRQVRKMTAAVGFPTLRLIRIAIGELSLAQLPLNTFSELTQQTVYKSLKL